MLILFSELIRRRACIIPHVDLPNKEGMKEIHCKLVADNRQGDKGGFGGFASSLPKYMIFTVSYNAKIEQFLFTL